MKYIYLTLIFSIFAFQMRSGSIVYEINKSQFSGNEAGEAFVALYDIIKKSENTSPIKQIIIGDPDSQDREDTSDFAIEVVYKKDTESESLRSKVDAVLELFFDWYWESTIRRKELEQKLYSDFIKRIESESDPQRKTILEAVVSYYHPMNFGNMANKEPIIEYHIVCDEREKLSDINELLHE